MKGVKQLKSIVAMGCITVLGAIQLYLYGDGSTLMACVTAIATLAGVQVGSTLAKKEK